MKIGIELNNIVRDINKQLVFYYKRDIVKDFDDENIDMNVFDISKKLKFEKKKDKFEYMYVDYPYEIFGCAKTTERNLAANLNNWLIDLSSKKNGKHDICLFSLKEEALSIQSTYFFLSKIGCRIREMFFPKDGVDMWNKCDVIITTNSRIITNKPNGKVVVLINKTDTSKYKSKCDLNYDSLTDLINDKEFISKVEKMICKENVSLFKKISNKIKKYIC